MRPIRRLSNYVGIAISGYYPNPNSPSGLSTIQGSLSLADFMRAGQTVTDPNVLNQLGTRTTSVGMINDQVASLSAGAVATNGRIDTLSATVTQQSNHITVLDGQIANLGTRMSAVEAGQQAILANQQAIIANKTYYIDALRAQHQEMNRGLALASPLALLAPAMGAHNPLGFGVG